MPATLTSPDPQIQALLTADTHATLDNALKAFIQEHKYVTTKVLPGMWRKFLESEYGIPWREDTSRTMLPPPVPKQPLDDQETMPYTTFVPATNGHKPAEPLQEDLFGLLAKGLQGRLQPQAAALDTAAILQLLEDRLETERQRSRFTIVVHEPMTTTALASDLPMPAWFPRVYKQALCRVHTLLVGPRGCGKTMTGELLAKALDLPFYTISLSAGVDEGVLQGWLLPVSDGLKFTYQRSKFVKAYEEGGVVLLDELDAADPNMLMIVNAALANGHWDIPLRGEDAPPLRRHPDFVCLAAANTHGHGADRVYVGRNQLDGATLDRFALGRVNCDYDEALEAAAYDSWHVAYGQRLRARCRAQKGWTRDVSTRNIADASKLQAQLNLEEAWYGYFEDWSDGELARVGAVRDRATMTVGLE